MYEELRNDGLGSDTDTLSKDHFVSWEQRNCRERKKKNECLEKHAKSYELEVGVGNYLIFKKFNFSQLLIQISHFSSSYFDRRRGKSKCPSVHVYVNFVPTIIMKFVP